MSATDDRIVRMQMNNSAFERAAQVSMNTLNKLKSSLNFGKTKDPLESAQRSASRFSMGHVTSAIDGVSKKFSALSTIGITALATITSKVVSSGLQMAKSLTLQPILDGFHEYETQLTSVQTILANTQASGATLGDVNAALNQLNHYADKTIYNFSEMAKNIGTFTAAGVDLNTSVSSIKGIANLAALSGSSAQQASTAMYQLSQAISAGRVGLQDWNSVVNAGMGGTAFQRALSQTAVAMGTLKDSSLKLVGPMKNVSINGQSFRNSITAKPGQTSWLTGKVLTTALKQFSGDLSDAQLKAIGFSKAQIVAIQKQAQTAQDAATKVKTFSQLMDTLKEAVGSGWTQTFQLIFGNFNQAKSLWTGAYNVLGKMINRSANARNKMLKDWQKAGGRDDIIHALSNAFDDLMAIIKPISAAFRDIFPAMTGARLAQLSKSLEDFTKRIKIGSDTAEHLKATFRGVFAIFDIGRQIISGIFQMFGVLFHTIFSGSGNMLKFTGHIGDMIVAFDKMLKNGHVIQNFFISLGHILAVPLQALGAVKDLVVGLFAGFSLHQANGVSNALGRIGDRMSSLGDVGARVRDFFANLWSQIQPGVRKLEDAFGHIGDAIASAFKTGNFSQIRDALNTGLLAGIALMVRKFFQSGMHIDVGGGIFEKLGGVFEGLTGNLEAMQASVKASTLLKIAAAVGILAASAVALALIDSEKLTTAMKALAVGFGELLGSMKILTAISGKAGMVKVPIIAASLNLLATSVLILTGAVKILSTMSTSELQRGLTAVGVLLGTLAASALVFSKNSAGVIRAGIAMNLFAVALNGMYLAVREFASLDWSQMLKGFAGVVGSLAAVAVGMRLMPKNMVLQAAGLVGISVALLILYKAVSGFARLNWLQMAKGMTGVAGSLLIIAGAMRVMPKGMIRQAAALDLVAAALLLIGKAVAKMGGMSWEQMARGLTTMAVSLGILAVALKAMQGSVSGAVSLGIVSASLLLLSSALKVLGGMSWDAIIHGLVALGGALTIMVGAAYLAEGAIPGLLALSVAAIGIGAGLALAGVGVGVLATGLGKLAQYGAEGVKTLLSAFAGLIKQLPALALGLAKGLVQFVVEIGKSAPKLAKAIGSVVKGMLDVLVQNIPRIVQAAIKLIDSLLTKLTEAAPRLLKEGADLLIALMKGLAQQLPRLIDQGFKMIIKFLNGLADAIRNNLGEVLKAAGNVGLAIVQGIWKGISGLVGWVWGKIKGFFSDLWDNILGFFGIHSPSRLAADLGGNIIKGIWNGIKNLAGWIGGLVGGFFKGLWHHITDIFSGALNLGQTIVKGIGHGISSAASWLQHAAGSILGGIWHFITGIFSGALNLGKTILTGIGHGISSAASWLQGKAKDILGGVWHFITGLFSGAVHLGQTICHGIASGISDAASGVRSAISDALNPTEITDGAAGKAYDAGKLFDQGLANGIADGTYLPMQAAIRMAGQTAQAARSGLRIESPSKVAMEIGDFFVRGLAKGIEDNAHKPSLAAGKLAKTVANALANLPSDVTTPTIRPVLDLDQVRKDASQISGLVGTGRVRADVSYSQASGISASRSRIAETASTTTAPVVDGGSVTFQQTINAPKALSTVEIYRQSRNLVSLAKSKLNLPVPS